MARQIVEVADRQDETTYKLVGHRLLGTMQFLKGQNREALKNLQKAERYRDPARQRLLSYRFAYDPGLAVPCSSEDCGVMFVRFAGPGIAAD